MRRPVGVAILATVLFLGIPYLVVAALALNGGGGFLSGVPIALLTYFSMFVDWLTHAVMILFLQLGVAGSAMAVTGLYVFLILIYVVAGVGLFRLQNWARLGVVILTSLNLGLAVMGFAGARFVLFRQSIFAIAIEVAVLVYLFLPETKTAFEASGL